MFSIMGIFVAKTLPADRELRILGMPNRWFVALAASVFCLLIELWLNAIGQLTWDYRWWNAQRPYLIFVFGYLWFFAFAFWVHDIADGPPQGHRGSHARGDRRRADCHLRDAIVKKKKGQTPFSHS